MEFCNERSFPLTVLPPALHSTLLRLYGMFTPTCPATYISALAGELVRASESERRANIESLSGLRRTIIRTSYGMEIYRVPRRTYYTRGFLATRNQLNRQRNRPRDWQTFIAAC